MGDDQLQGDRRAAAGFPADEEPGASHNDPGAFRYMCRSVGGGAVVSERVDALDVDACIYQGGGHGVHGVALEQRPEIWRCLAGAILTPVHRGMCAPDRGTPLGDCARLLVRSADDPQ